MQLHSISWPAQSWPLVFPSLLPPPAPANLESFQVVLSRNVLNEGWLRGANSNLKMRTASMHVLFYLLIYVVMLFLVRWGVAKMKREGGRILGAWALCLPRLPRSPVSCGKLRVSRPTVTISSIASSPLSWPRILFFLSFSVKPWQGCPRGEAFLLKITCQGQQPACHVLKYPRTCSSRPACLLALPSLLGPVSWLSWSGCDLDSLAVAFQVPALDAVCLAHSLCTQTMDGTQAVLGC